MTIKDNLPKFLENLKAMQTKAVFVGIPHEETRRNECAETNAEIGFLNEFGSAVRNIPPRPFLNTGVKDAQQKIINILKEGGQNALHGEDINISLEKAGLVAQSSVKNKIVNGEFAPLSERTITARQRRRLNGKAGTKPLIDTGQLLSSITYVVRNV